MKKEEFMRELEYLLQDIPDEDKADALAYYRDYIEEAGPGNEDAVLRDFGSPERIAAMIRCDIYGILGEGGEFTDQGYEDERFRDPRVQLVPRADPPQAGEANRNQRQAAPRRAAEEKEAGRRRWAWWQIAGMIFLICMAAPMAVSVAVGIGGGAVGILILLVTVLAAVTIALAAAVFALLLGGAVFIGIGLAHMAVPLQGFLFLGSGIGILGLGILGLALCGIYYGRFLPWLCRGTVNGISRLLHRRRR